MAPKSATFRFYEELNDFLNKNNKKQDLYYSFYGSPTVKDAIESFGIPHTEVDLILANGVSVDFNYKLKTNDRISVYPKFETFEISSVTKLRQPPLRKILFILDVHLGKLTRYLRLTGFDCYYHNSLKDNEIVDIAENENRIILTRDKGLLKHNKVTHGYYVRSGNPRTQLKEVLKRFDLKNRVTMFTRCMDCNGPIEYTPKEDVQKQLPEGTKKYYNEFYQCMNCGKIYWKGSHFFNMTRFIESILEEI